MIYDGKKITALRVQKEWSGAELAKRARLSAPVIWALEHQVTKKPKYDTLTKIAAALGVPVREIASTRLSNKDAAELEEQLLAIFQGARRPQQSGPRSGCASASGLLVSSGPT